MQELFSILSRAVEDSALIAILAAGIWGILSIILSPCHLASIPLIVAFIDQQGRVSTRRAFAIATLFSFGILVTIAIIGVVTAMAGRLVGDIGAWGNYFVAAIFLLVGLHLLGVIPMPFSGPGQVSMKQRGLLAALVLGLVFGLALGPCTFAFMAPVLAVSFRAGAEAPLFAGILLLAYGVGHCGVIVAAGGSTQWVQRYLNWTSQARGASVLRHLCGVLVIAGGLWMLYTA